MNTFQSIISGFGNIADILTEKDKLNKINSFDGFASNADTIVYAINKFIDLDPTALLRLNSMTLAIARIGKSNSKDIVETTKNLSDFIEKINDTSIDKLKAAADLMKNIADLSKSIDGNFEKLADTLNDKLMKVLEELKEILDKTSEEIENHHSSVKASIVNSQSQSGGSDKSRVNNINTPDGKKEDKRVDLSATNDAIDRVTGAINELYSLVYTQYK